MKITEYKEFQYFPNNPVEFVEELQKLIEEYKPDSIELRHGEDYDCSYAYLEFSISREESPEEVALRQKREEHVRNLRRNQYEQLKKEFEGTK